MCPTSTTTAIPLYYRIQMELRQAIVSGKWALGEEIPSEKELAKAYGCSRRTIQHALEGLVTDGLLTRRRGKGTFVAEQQIVQPVGRIYSTSETIRNRGQVPGTRLIDLKEVSGESLARKIALPETMSKVYVLKRLRLADGKPLTLMTTYLPVDLLPDFPNQLVKSDSLYDVLERIYGYRLTEAEETISACLLSKEEAKLLECDIKIPALKTVRVTQIDTGRTIEYMEELFRGDRFSISVRLVGRDSRGGRIDTVT